MNQADLEKIEKELLESLASLNNSLFPNTASQEDLDRLAGDFDRLVGIDVKGCDHQWVPYDGLFESYKYCDKCDMKEK